MEAISDGVCVTYLEVDQLVPYPGNPRVNDGAVDAVARSIQQFGFRVPIIADGSRVIVAGHTRLKAALQLGIERVPVITAGDLTPEQIRAFRLADNRTAELADWDMEALQEELEALAGYDVDMSDFGFEDRDGTGLEEPSVADLTGDTDTYFETVYALNIVCESERHQAALFERLTAEGLRVRVVNV